MYVCTDDNFVVVVMFLRDIVFRINTMKDIFDFIIRQDLLRSRCTGCYPSCCFWGWRELCPQLSSAGSVHGGSDISYMQDNSTG